MANKAKKMAATKGERRPRRKESYSIYVYKVLKQVHTDLGVSSKAMLIMNSLVHDVYERIYSEATKLVKYNRKATITSRDIQTAVKLVLPGELAKHAVSEGTKAVTKFTASKKPPGNQGGTKKGATKSVSRSARAGLQFPVGRVQRHMKKNGAVRRVAAGSAIYLAAVMEYIAAEVLELAGNAAKDLKKKRINPRHMLLAVRGDEELDTMIGRTTIAQGGVVPHIHKILVDKKKTGGEKGRSQSQEY